MSHVRRSSEALPVLQVLVLAATIEVLLQSLRAFFPLGYHLVGSFGFLVTPLLLVTVFLAPLLAPVIRGLLGGAAAAACLVALLTARLVLQAVPTLAVAAAAVAVGLVAVTVLLPRAAGGPFGADVIASATLIAVGMDIALRAWRATDDVVWSDGLAAWLDPSLLVPLAVIAAGVRAFGASTAPDRPAPMWTWTVLLMPQLLLWTSPAFVGSSSGASLALTAAVLITAVAVAMAVLGSPRFRARWHVSAAVLLAAAAGTAWLNGWPVLLLAGAAIVVTPLLLRSAAIRARSRAWSSWRSAGAATAGWITMFVLLLLYPLHYELPLPVDNSWLPVAAVLLSCLPLLRTPSQEAAGYAFARPSGLHVPGLVLTGAAAVLVGLAVHLGMVGGSPAPGPSQGLATGEPSPGLRSVATYNTGQGQDAGSGAMAVRAVAEAIVGLDADVVALQEVARGWPLSGMVDFEAWLRANTDYELHYLAAADRQFGNALVSRVPLSAVDGIDLGQQGGAQRRSALRAMLTDGTTVYGTHLQARNSEAAEQSRLEQMRRIVADWDGRPRTVVAGDLNPRNEYLDATETPPKAISNLEVFLDAGLVTTQPTVLCTDPTSNDNCSDYIFTSGDVVLESPNEVVPVEVTDHRPVIARLAQ